jgi:hypothetical protein
LGDIRETTIPSDHGPDRILGTRRFNRKPEDDCEHVDDPDGLVIRSVGDDSSERSKTLTP